MKIDTHLPFGKIQILGADAVLKEKLDKIEKLAREENGGYVRLIISNVAKPRSTGEGSQNHHLNGHIQFICQDTGNSFEHVKEVVKQMAIPMGYPMKVNQKGDTVLDMYGNPVGISEADCSVQECSLLIEAVHRLGAELGYESMPED